jgi:hypothetical protein
MKSKKFKIDVYDWNIYYLETEKKSDSKKVEKIFKKLTVPEDDIKDIIGGINRSCINGGEHLFYLGGRYSIIFLYKSTKRKKKIEMISHETRHVVDRMKEYLNLEGTEASAYITGYIMKKLYKML